MLGDLRGCLCPIQRSNTFLSAVTSRGGTLTYQAVRLNEKGGGIAASTQMVCRDIDLGERSTSNPCAPFCASNCEESTLFFSKKITLLLTKMTSANPVKNVTMGIFLLSYINKALPDCH